LKRRGWMGQSDASFEREGKEGKESELKLENTNLLRIRRIRVDTLDDRVGWMQAGVVRV